MSLTKQQRDRLSDLADVLIPAASGHLSASQADVAGPGLDQVLTTCPEMAQGLRDVLSKAGGGGAAAAVANLRSKHPAAFGVLAEFAAGAYFLNPAVREAIGYAGQTARPIDPAPDYLENGLLDSVIRRGPIFRPTPTAQQHS
jgi:hypothetical protein